MTASPSGKRILHLDLESLTAETKVHPDFEGYLGGLALSLGLLKEYLDRDPLVFAIGPLTGFYPFCSKTVATFVGREGLGEAYAGGRLALVLRLAGLDGLLLLGQAYQEVGVSVEPEEARVGPVKSGRKWAESGYPGRRSFLKEQGENLLVDDHFSFGSSALVEKWRSKRVSQVLVSGTGSVPLPKGGDYEQLYQKLLDFASSLSVTATGKRSCSGCPLGCSEAAVGEAESKAIISHCLVSCGFAQEIYENVPLVFSCLSALSIPYTHDQLEALPSLVYNLREVIASEIETAHR